MSGLLLSSDLHDIIDLLESLTDVKIPSWASHPHCVDEVVEVRRMALDVVVKAKEMVVAVGARGRGEKV